MRRLDSSAYPTTFYLSKNFPTAAASAIIIAVSKLSWHLLKNSASSSSSELFTPPDPNWVSGASRHLDLILPWESKKKHVAGLFVQSLFGIIPIAFLMLLELSKKESRWWTAYFSRESFSELFTAMQSYLKVLDTRLIRKRGKIRKSKVLFWSYYEKQFSPAGGYVLGALLLSFPLQSLFTRRVSRRSCCLFRTGVLMPFLTCCWENKRLRFDCSCKMDKSISFMSAACNSGQANKSSRSFKGQSHGLKGCYIEHRSSTGLGSNPGRGNSSDMSFFFRNFSRSRHFLLQV